MPHRGLVLLLLAALVVGCRDRRATEQTAHIAPSASASGSISAGVPVELRGWFVVTTGSKDGGRRQVGAGWWFSTDTVRTVWIGGRDRRAITSSQKQGDLLHLVVEDDAFDVTRTETGLVLKLAGDDQPLRLRLGTDDEGRAMEKLDAQLVAKSGDACPRATTCCEAARLKKLATDEDCAAITSTPELSRCVRLLERLRKRAAADGQPLPECAEAP